VSNIKQHIVAVAYDKRGRELAVGVNSYVKTHPLQAKYAKRSANPKRPFLHAELDALLKGSRRGKVYRLHVVRLCANGVVRLAKPCDMCQRAIQDYGVKYVSWSK